MNLKPAASPLRLLILLAILASLAVVVSFRARPRAEETINRLYRGYLETAQRMKYFEDGHGRLAHLRDTDPQEVDRTRERLAARQERLMDVHRAVMGTAVRKK